ncbi:hypothetical protein [Candidatus Berkiella aquae]|uniref:Tetratricopeptide repeat protein n=1 Tax=Candidatus Berkiella aquae TaxID=295108 RepID=A0A0Q9YKS9_9GAMM|nr:hypothetical protein [Candidatus Berkiella aquae]MCS5710893.1 hypothetical protein [Candidatus Berkiella aquae]
MLNTQLLPPGVRLDEDLKRTVDDCAASLNAKPSPPPEMISQTLKQLGLAVVEYVTKHKAKCFQLLESSKPIKIKKAILLTFVGGTVEDIPQVSDLIAYCYELFDHESANTQFEGVFKPLIDFISDVLNEVTRINAYGNDIKDILRFQLATLHSQIANLYLLVYQREKTVFHLQEKFSLVDAIQTEQYKGLYLSDIYCMVTVYLDINDLVSAAKILCLEREKCIRNAGIYSDFCVVLANKLAKQRQYSDAITWYKEAFNINETQGLNLKIDNLIADHIDQMTQYLETLTRSSSIQLEPSEQMSKRMMMAADYHVVIAVAIPEWSPEYITRLKQLAGKFAFDFAPEKLIVHKLSSVSVKNLAKIIGAINKLEKEHQTRLNRPFENPIVELQSRIEALTIDELLPVCSSSHTASIPSCSTDTVAPSSAKKASIKRKTRGKPQKRQQVALKVTQAPRCDAEKYGFSRTLFGMHAFQECRMRGDSQRVFYVVKGKIEASNRRHDNQYLFDSLISEPKIVPPCGEEGFKWMKVGERQVLVGKVLSTKKRLFPTLAQRNEQGAIAFLYGSIVNTKNGVATYEVKHYAPPAKPKPGK